MFMPLVALAGAPARDRGTHAAIRVVVFIALSPVVVVVRPLVAGRRWGSPVRLQPPFDDAALEAAQRAVAVPDAGAVRDVELPAVFRAGQRRAVERELRDVGRLVRTAA